MELESTVKLGHDCVGRYRAQPTKPTQPTQANLQSSATASIFQPLANGDPTSRPAAITYPDTLRKTDWHHQMRFGLQ